MLLALFTNHPVPITYKIIKSILKNNQLTCPDETRLHRKVSELRSFLAKFHPGIENIIYNTRGIGYSLPLYFKDLESSFSLSRQRLKNKHLEHILNAIQYHVTESLALTRKCHIIKSDNGFVLERKAINSDIEKILGEFEKQKRNLFSELKSHSQDFITMRIEFTLAKLKTYLGLVRISEFSITKDQWLEWHKHESNHLLEELILLLKQVE